MPLGAHKETHHLWSLRLIAKDHLMTAGHLGTLSGAYDDLLKLADSCQLTGRAEIYTNGGTVVLKLQYRDGRQVQ